MTSKILVLLHSLFKILNPSYSIQNKSQKEAEIIQKKVFNQLIISAKNTKFGKDHKFNKIKTYQDFKKRVDIRDYEQKKVYIDRIKKGEKDVLWKGKPLYFCKNIGDNIWFKIYSII